MIFLYVIFLLLGVLVFIVTYKISMPFRIGIALATAVIPSVLVTLWLLKVGDQPAADARTVWPPDAAGKSEEEVTKARK